MRQGTSQCANCGETAKCRPRDFSSQIWVLLLRWGEVVKSTVGQPICDSCYRDLRNLLIDRATEMENAMRTGELDNAEHDLKNLIDPIADENGAGSKPKIAKISKAS